MSPEVLHEETHVPEVLRADAALKSWTLGSGLCHVGVREHLALLFEQDVVGWTHDLLVEENYAKLNPIEQVRNC